METSKHPDIKLWRKVLGYSEGEKLKLIRPYKYPRVKKGEIGTIVNCWDTGDEILGWCFILKFPRKRKLVVFSDEVEEV